VVKVGVREQDVADVQVVRLRGLEQLLDFVARIDQHRLVRFLAADHVAVLEEGRSRADLENHG
jgi:hypothetical protein